jgi:hypothetical protein
MMRCIEGGVEIEEIGKLIFSQPTLFQKTLDCGIELCH